MLSGVEDVTECSYLAVASEGPDVDLEILQSLAGGPYRDIEVDKRSGLIAAIENVRYIELVEFEIVKDASEEVFHTFLSGAGDDIRNLILHRACGIPYVSLDIIRQLGKDCRNVASPECVVVAEIVSTLPILQPPQGSPA